MEGASKPAQTAVARHIPDKTFAFEQDLLKRIQALGTKGIGTKPLIAELLRIDYVFKYGDVQQAQPRLDKLAAAVTDHERYLKDHGNTSFDSSSPSSSSSPSPGVDPWAGAASSSDPWGAVSPGTPTGKKKHSKTKRSSTVGYMIPPPPPTPYALVSPPPAGVVRPDQLQQLGMSYNRTR
jgi:hypothetical protein